MTEPGPAPTHVPAAAGRRLTVHVLDTASGRPAAGLALRLVRDGRTLAERTTNDDGRCDSPLLDADAFPPGAYEITFDVAAWREGHALPDPGFYDRITLRFVTRPDDAHVHIPLLLSPYGYSTYRGS